MVSSIHHSISNLCVPFTMENKKNKMVNQSDYDGTIEHISNDTLEGKTETNKSRFADLIPIDRETAERRREMVKRRVEQRQIERNVHWLNESANRGPGIRKGPGAMLSLEDSFSDKKVSSALPPIECEQFLREKDEKKWAQKRNSHLSEVESNSSTTINDEPYTPGVPKNLEATNISGAPSHAHNNTMSSNPKNLVRPGPNQYWDQEIGEWRDRPPFHQETPQEALKSEALRQKASNLAKSRRKSKCPLREFFALLKK